MLVGSSPGATTFPASMSLASFAFSDARPGVSTPAPAAWEIGSPPRPRRITAHPTAIAAPAGRQLGEQPAVLELRIVEVIPVPELQHQQVVGPLRVVHARVDGS